MAENIHIYKIYNTLYIILYIKIRPSFCLFNQRMCFNRQRQNKKFSSAIHFVETMLGAITDLLLLSYLSFYAFHTILSLQVLTSFLQLALICMIGSSIKILCPPAAVYVSRLVGRCVKDRILSRSHVLN